MTIMPQIVDDFLESISKAVGAIQQCNGSQVTQHAENAYLRGQLLAIHPEFVRQVQTRYPGLNATTMVDSVSQVLLCIAAARCNGKLAQPVASGMPNGQRGLP